MALRYGDFVRVDLRDEGIAGTAELYVVGELVAPIDNREPGSDAPAPPPDEVIVVAGRQYDGDHFVVRASQCALLGRSRRNVKIASPLRARAKVTLTLKPLRSKKP